MVLLLYWLASEPAAAQQLTTTPWVADSVLSALVVRALASDTQGYLWVGTSTGATTTFTASKAGAFTYAVAVTSSSGCVAQAQVTLTVVDARCGNKNDKVVVCHLGMALCIGAADVADHLRHGDALGACSGKAKTASAPVVATPAAPLDAQAAALLEAYPNPFTASTTVRFRPAQDGAVRAVVYNVLGQPVATLYDGAAQAGQVVERTLAGTDLSAGLYTVRLTGGGHSLVQRVVLTK